MGLLSFVTQTIDITHSFILPLSLSPSLTRTSALTHARASRSLTRCAFAGSVSKKVTYLDSKLLFKDDTFFHVPDDFQKSGRDIEDDEDDEHEVHDKGNQKHSTDIAV